MQVNYGTINTLYGDVFIFWPLYLNLQNFKTCLNMYATIKLTFENLEIIMKTNRNNKF